MTVFRLIKTIILKARMKQLFESDHICFVAVAVFDSEKLNRKQRLKKRDSQKNTNS